MRKGRSNFAFTTLVFFKPGGGVLNDREHFLLWWNGVHNPLET